MRKTKEVTISNKKSRDDGKTYVITEMPAEQAEWWAFRVLQAILGSDAEIDFDAPFVEMAKQGLSALGKMSPDKAKPLLDEMMDCVRMKIKGTTRDLIDGDIEEVSTRIQLRKEVFNLHVDFLESGAQ